MKQRQFYIIALSCVLLVSCNTTFVSPYIKKNFTNCFKGGRNETDTLINTQGYFRIINEYDRYGINAIYKHQLDTFYLDFFLSPDGMFFYNCFFDRKLKINRNKPKQFPYFSHGKGCFVINGDTIIAQWISKYIQTNFAAWECKYKIVDKNTLLFIGSKPLHKTYPTPAIELERREQKERNFESYFGRKRVVSDTATFIPLQEVPPSDCWLKKKRWFWCSKEKFKAWKKEKKR